MRLSVEVEQEEDGRWLGEVPELPGVLAYGQTRAEAIVHAEVLALRVIADRVEHGEPLPQKADVLPQVFSVAACFRGPAADWVEPQASKWRLAQSFGACRLVGLCLGVPRRHRNRPGHAVPNRQTNWPETG